MSAASSDVARCHDEVLNALTDLAASTGIPPDRGARVQADRQSAFDYIGLRTPDRRKRVGRGFSFTTDPAAPPLAIWDGIWNLTTNGDVLFAALDFYRKPGSRSTPASMFSDPGFWETVQHWIDRIDNWAHADDLARVYSFALEAVVSGQGEDLVFPTLEAWSRDDDRWRKRISIVSLIHYSGKNAVFLPPEPVLRLVANCVGDPRDSVYKAVGWVLRETMRKHPDEVDAFLETHADQLHPSAVRRARS